jgi:Cys-tRNA(Pro)/Cys-tRNA(Cys) deacylase
MSVATQWKHRIMNLEFFLKSKGAVYKFIEKAPTVHTADAATATGIPAQLITKSLVCIGDDGKAYVAIIPGNKKLRPKSVAQAFGLKKIRLCPFEQAHKYSGYPPGATPPVYYRAVAGVVLDKELLERDELYGGGGSNSRLIRIRTQDVVRLNRAVVRSISYNPT